MNHLRPPSGFVFVLCFVSEGVGRESEETMPWLGAEYQFRARVHKHWGYSLRPRGDSGGLRRPPAEGRSPRGERRGEGEGRGEPGGLPSGCGRTDGRTDGRGSSGALTSGQPVLGSAKKWAVKSRCTGAGSGERGAFPAASPGTVSDGNVGLAGPFAQLVGTP